MKADILIRSHQIFSEGQFFDGFVAIQGDSIVAADSGMGSDYVGNHTEVIDVGSKIVMPGMIDTHAFFSGYALQSLGCDAANVQNMEELAALFRESGQTSVYFAQNVPSSLEIDFAALEKEFPGAAILCYNWAEEIVRLNEEAKRQFSFKGEELSSESQWKIIRYALQLKPWIEAKFAEYMKLLNSRGVTTTKEMLFDDGSGLAEIMKEFHLKGEKTLRNFLMSQPVGHPMSLDTAAALTGKVDDDFTRFDGFNQMTDGSVSVKEADVKLPYEDGVPCQINIDYETIRSNVLKADAAGYRYSLHAQGDAAISKSIDIFSSCQRAGNGKLLHRHAITDLELSDPADLRRMAELGVKAEVYPQILSIYDDSAAKIKVTHDRVGSRSHNYWNRKGMVAAGVSVSCATDLPLVIDNLGSSIYHSCFGLFADGAPFETQNCWTLKNLLTAWTVGGAENLGAETYLGKIKEGYKADLIILNVSRDEINPDTARNISVVRTLIDGKTVYGGAL